MKFDLFDTR